MNPKSHLFSLPLSSSKREGKNSACDSSLCCKNTTLELVASLWKNDLHMFSASKLLKKIPQMKQHKSLLWLGAARSSQGLYRLSSQREQWSGLFASSMEPGCSPCMHWLSQMRKGTMCWQTALQGAESALGQERGFPAACIVGTDTEQLLGCRGGTQGWLRCQRLDLGLLLWDLQLLRSFLGSCGQSQADPGWWLSESLCQQGTGHRAQSPWILQGWKHTAICMGHWDSMGQYWSCDWVSLLVAWSWGISCRILMGTWAYKLCQGHAKQEEETLGVCRYPSWGFLLSGDTAGQGQGPPC